jgi:predicted Rossmann fold nucleotide-binding protein DprA/Smf involved in DNA uptake
MITARKALVQGRDVFAVPGNIDESNAKGTNSLIKDGANTVLCARDIIDNYELNYGRFINYTGLAFANEVYKFSEETLEKMGIGARNYNNEYKDSRVGELKKSELRPSRRPFADINRSKAPSTETPDGLGPDPRKLPKETPRRCDGSEELLKKLDEKARRIFEEIPIDHAISIEKLCALGYTVGDVMLTLTTLEINGLISTLPGSLYIRR